MSRPPSRPKSDRSAQIAAELQASADSIDRWLMRRRHPAEEAVSSPALPDASPAVDVLPHPSPLPGVLDESLQSLPSSQVLREADRFPSDPPPQTPVPVQPEQEQAPGLSVVSLDDPHRHEDEYEDEDKAEPFSGISPIQQPSSTPVDLGLDPALGSPSMSLPATDVFAPDSPPPLPMPPKPTDDADEGPVDDIQEDILPIVAEELEELIPDIDQLLTRLSDGDRSSLPDLHRKVHTLKGTVAMAGAMRIRTLVHSMETWMEKAGGGSSGVGDLDRVLSLFESIKQRVVSLLSGAPSDPWPSTTAPSIARPATPTTPTVAPLPAPRQVRVSAQEMDRLAAENNEVRLSAAAMAAGLVKLRSMLQELLENGQRLARIQRDLEIHAESQIQSRRAQLAESGAEFDPLELDRFTRLQEISRFLAEGVSDATDIYRDLTRQASEHDALMAEQDRSILEIGEGLRRTRLVPVDVINDRLHKVVWSTARELGKSAEFRMGGGASQGMDRVLLDRLVAPLEHILRNAVAHGIEDPAGRKAAGKPPVGDVLVVFRQDAGRVAVEVIDDGAGLNPERIRAKAVERGLWPSDKPMDEQAAADMICTPGFSTAETVSQISGRGVGMDVVRSDVLGMGGRFEITNRQGHGLRVAMFLPLTVASVSAVAVEAGSESFAIPVEIVEHTSRLSGESLATARATGLAEIQMPLGPVTMPYSDLAPWLGLGTVSPSISVPVLVLREGDRRIALGADRMLGIADLPLRPLGQWWSGLPGVMGGVLLSNGHAAFLVDPLRMRSLATNAATASSAAGQGPTVLVVDDSITVRKATAMFLEKNGYRPVLARDGQEALEILVDLQPAAILMDVEMPKMDGFDCARNIKENSKLATIPIAMVTSRTAEKHRRRAQSLGVAAYFGKPFNEEQLLEWLRACVTLPT